jgi:hypothetical protein
MSGMAPLGGAASSVSSRFNLVGLAPTALLATTVGALAASGAFTGLPSIELLIARSSKVNVFIAGVLFLVVFSVALVIHPFQLPLVRLLEGYWEDIPVLRSLRYIGIEINRRRRWEINVLRRDTELGLRLYPPETEDLLPTRLGNVLRSAERQAGESHGFSEPIDMLPRIYPYISPSLAENVGDARAELDIACRMCVVLWLIAVLVGCTLVADGAVAASAGAWLAAPAAAAILGIFSYRAAVRSAENYGQILYSVFDLHRRDLIRALGYVPPEDPGDEKQLIEDITRWLVKREPVGPANYREKPPSDSAAGQLRCQKTRAWLRRRRHPQCPHRKVLRRRPGTRSA